MDNRAFEDGLLRAYRGERAAVVTLRSLLEQGLSDEERFLAELVLAVETAVGNRLEPLVKRRGLPVSLGPEAVKEARERARVLAGWPGVAASLDEGLEGYVAEFAALRAAAPPEERRVFDLLVDHEVALMRFGALVREGRTAEATSVLLAFLPSDAALLVRSSEKGVLPTLEVPPGAA